MKLGLLGQIAATFAPLSLVAVGGANAVIPDMHRQVVTVHGWMDDTAFANLFAIAKAAPGPNVMVVSLVGWQLAGILGLIVATIAMCGPSCLLTFAFGRLRARLIDAPWLKMAQRALVPIAIGLMLASGLVIAESAAANWLRIAVSVVTVAVVFGTEISPLWCLIGGAGLGMLYQMLG